MNIIELGHTLVGLFKSPYDYLIWYETIDIQKRPSRKLPGKELLKHTSKLATPVDTTKGRNEELSASLVLNTQIFFNSYLIPELQELYLTT